MKQFVWVLFAMGLELFGAVAFAGNTDWTTSMSGKRTGLEGPNCFSAAMMQITGKTDIRYVASEELAFWLDRSGRCQIVQDASKKQAGDVVVLYDGALDQGTEGHAFVYLSKTQVFSKNGTQGSVPYLIQDPKPMLKLYGFSGDDWDRDRCQTPNASSGCQKLARVFRCKTGDAPQNGQSQKATVVANTTLKKFFSLAKNEQLTEADRRQLISDLEEQQSELEEQMNTFGAGGAAYWRVESAKQNVNDYYQ